MWNPLPIPNTSPKSSRSSITKEEVEGVKPTRYNSFVHLLAGSTLPLGLFKNIGLDISMI